MHDPQVSICIPTWQSEGFIDRTLTYARNQSWRNLRILVSIDKSDDRTAEICQHHAREDGRVEVFIQRERLGWARNVNFLLNKVSSEYFFIYFHDDIIDSRYTEKLLTRINEHSDAACAYCDVLAFTVSGRQTLSPGRDFYGTKAERFLNFALSARVGEPLRGLIRTSVTGFGLRFAESSKLGIMAHLPFQLQIFSAGPVLRLPEILYWRLEQRKGGLVDKWRTVSHEDLIDDQRANAQKCLSLIDGMDASSSDAMMMRFSLYTMILKITHSIEIKIGMESLVDPSVIAPEFRFTSIPLAIKDVSPEIRKWAISRYAWLSWTDSWYYLKRGDFKNALARLRTLEIKHALVMLRVLGSNYLYKTLPKRLFPVAIPADFRERLEL